MDERRPRRGLDRLEASRKLGDFLRALPPGQRYELIEHDPTRCRDGVIFTVKLVGPPAMVDDEFVGWNAL